jgi:hypothetical protein
VASTLAMDRDVPSPQLKDPSGTRDRKPSAGGGPPTLIDLALGSTKGPFGTGNDGCPEYPNQPIQVRHIFQRPSRWI